MSLQRTELSLPTDRRACQPASRWAYKLCSLKLAIQPTIRRELVLLLIVGIRRVVNAKMFAGCLSIKTDALESI